MTIDYQTKEAKIKELIANATSPRDKAFYESLLKKAVAERPKQIVSVSPAPLPLKAKSPPREEKPSVKNTVTSSQDNVVEPKDEKIEVESKQLEKVTVETEAEKPSANELKIGEIQKPPTEFTSKITKKDEESALEQPKSEKHQKKHFFQSIGLITGRVSCSTKGLIIKIEGRKYQLRFAPSWHQKRRFEELKAEIAEQGATEKSLIVYPQILPVKENYEVRKVNFVLVDAKNLHHWKELEAGEFLMAGIWEYIPQSSITSITIRRNENPDLKKLVKKLHKVPRKKITQPKYIPCEWSEAEVKPFRYSEEEGKKAPKRYFVKVKTLFMPESNSFKVREQLAKPTRNIPSYIK